MMSLLVQMLIKNKDEVSNPSVKKAYATLSSVVGIMLNLFLCVAKIVIGLLSHSVSISADGFNNLSDAGTNLVSLLGFKIARYGGGSTHHKCELKQAILVKLLYGTRYSGFFGIAFFLTNNVNTFYL